MARPIIPRLVRGDISFQVANVLFPTFAEAVFAWAAAPTHRLDTVEQDGGL